MVWVAGRVHTLTNVGSGHIYCVQQPEWTTIYSAKNIPIPCNVGYAQALPFNHVQTLSYIQWTGYSINFFYLEEGRELRPFTQM